MCPSVPASWHDEGLGGCTLFNTAFGLGGHVGPARCGWPVEPIGSKLVAGGLIMKQSEFEADLRREGYQVFYGGLQAGMVNPDHAHDWDARVMVVGGEITLIRDGNAETFRAGDSCAVPAGEVHAERVGPQGVAYIVGRRNAGG
jgi:mannose-6-phosphate isomerase-like protein (cupin superfamily)